MSTGIFCDDVRSIGSEEEYVELKSNRLIAGDSLPNVNDIIVVGDLLMADMGDDDARIQMFMAYMIEISCLERKISILY